MKLFLLLVTLLFSSCSPSITYTPNYNAAPCSVTALPNGQGSLISCTDGSSQQILNGISANTITVVQLCPGVSAYAAVMEVAFCIEGNLFALEENPGSSDLILGVLPPGAYSDHNGNLGCNFSVVSGCQISQ